MSELQKFLNKFRNNKKLFDELYRTELEKEKHIQELFPAYSIDDKQELLDIVTKKMEEKITKELEEAFMKDMG
tara:strand:+ start:1093 stop:1311 length:219 start_codon:yes stop_codon:yes gene_type:complete